MGHLKHFTLSSTDGKLRDYTKSTKDTQISVFGNGNHKEEAKELVTILKNAGLDKKYYHIEISTR